MNQNSVGKLRASFPISLFYPMAAVLVVLPLADTLIGLIPVRPGSVQWRAGAVGLVSGAMMFPLIGCFLALAAAYLLDHVWVRRILAGVYGAAGIGFLLVIVFFGLDLLQIRREIAPEMLRSYDVATVKGLLTLLGEGSLLLMFGVTAIRQDRAERIGERSRARLASPLIARLSQ